MRRLLPIVLLAAITPWAFAQTTVTARFPSPARPAPQTPMSRVRSLPSGEDFAAFRNFRGHNPHQLPFFPFGLFSDSLFPDNPSPSESPAAPSALNLIEALSALGKPSEQPPPPPSQPLLIELQGDRYVRLSSGELSENPRNDREPVRVVASAIPARTHATTNAAIHPPAARELPPAVLIFRDGHSEEVRDYSIVGGVMYARGDYYTDGYWNKKIELAALNLPETLKSNRARGVPFVLPNAPNEVVTRP
jgi:hypothetical protein